MFTDILIVLIALFGVFSVVVALQPPEFSIVRSASFKATAAALYAQIVDFHRWQDWSFWAKLDPNANNTYEGPAAGKGSIFMWSGNNKVGEGCMLITECKENEFILIRLEFMKPFRAVNVTEFTFKEQDGETVVKWSMSGVNNFMAKAFNLIMDCDKMIGGQFEKGLENLRAIVETKSA